MQVHMGKIHQLLLQGLKKGGSPLFFWRNSTKGGDIMQNTYRQTNPLITSRAEGKRDSPPIFSPWKSTKRVTLCKYVWGKVNHF